MTVPRPDPDVLLRRVQDQAARARRGQLKVFLGASPGVGKTFTMLEAARAKRAEGLDVVVGVVETHGRAETARLLDGLELLPRASREYRGTLLEEFDLDAALARRPALLLVDELAHTNAPGSRHAKRWQDVEELLAERGDHFLEQLLAPKKWSGTHVEVLECQKIERIERRWQFYCGAPNVQLRRESPALLESGKARKSLRVAHHDLAVDDAEPVDQRVGPIRAPDDRVALTADDRE